MSNTKYLLTAGTKSTDLATALTAYYGAGVTILYNASPYLIFSCAAISDKVIKINFDNETKVYYGDAWTSGSTITNSIQFFDCYSSSYGTINYNAYVVLCSNSLVVRFTGNGSSYYNVCIGKLSNNKFMAMGLTTRDNYSQYSKGYITEENTRIWIAIMNGKFKSGTGNIVTFPIYFQYNTGNLVLNADNTPAYLLNLQQSPSVGTVESSTNFFSSGGNGVIFYQDIYATYGTFENAIVASLT